jgi:hypothetical protein
VVGQSAVAPGTIQVSSALTSRLAAFGQTQAAVDAVLSLLLIGRAVIGAVVVFLGVHLPAGHRAGEFALLQVRGAAPSQLGKDQPDSPADDRPGSVAGVTASRPTPQTTYHICFIVRPQRLRPGGRTLRPP